MGTLLERTIHHSVIARTELAVMNLHDQVNRLLMIVESRLERVYSNDRNQLNSLSKYQPKMIIQYVWNMIFSYLSPGCRSRLSALDFGQWLGWLGLTLDRQLLVRWQRR